MAIPEYMSFAFNRGSSLGPFVIDEAQVFINKNGIKIPYGNPIPETEIITDDSKHEARLAMFLGGIYAAVGTHIYRSIDGAQTWQVVHTPVIPANNWKILNHINLNGTPTLCFRGENGAFTLLHRSTDGVNWETFSQATSQRLSANYGDVYHNNIIYSMPSSSVTPTQTAINYLDFNGGTPYFGTIENLSSSYGIGALCKFKGRIYHARLGGRATGVTTSNVYDVTDRTGVLVATINHTATGSLTDGTRWAMFSDDTNMYLFHYGNNADGWNIYQIDDAFAVTDITSTVRHDYFANFGDSRARATVLADYNTDPTSPTFYIFARRGASILTTNQWGIFQWNGNAAEMTNIGFGGDIYEAVNWSTESRGDLFNSIGSNNAREAPRVEIISKTLNETSIDIEYQLFYGSGSNFAGNLLTNVSSFYQNSATASNPTLPATLSNTSNGSINGNTVENLVVDNGATTFQVRWQIATDGLSGERYILRCKAVNV